jgi:hypothetical protein
MTCPVCNGAGRIPSPHGGSEICPACGSAGRVVSAPATTKPTNPKDAIGSDKLPLHLWPSTATAAGSIALLNGALKYGRTNWRDAGVRATIYIDAILRHTLAYLEGEDTDPDDGVDHVAAILAGAAILVDAKAAGMLTDDRAYRGAGFRDLVKWLTPEVARLKALHARKNPKHFTIGDEGAAR